MKSRLRRLSPILCALCTVFSIPSLGEAKAPPNIVLIISDDQSYTDYSFMGHESIETPHLDRLASEGTLFRRGYVPTALCRPSLMMLATGLYAHQNRTTGNDPAATSRNAAYSDRAGKSERELLISHIDRTGALPKWLAEKGYVSHQSGKWWEGGFSRGGFTAGMTRGYPQPGGRHGDDGLKIGRTGMAPVLDFIDRAVADKKPFFVWYAPFMPHTPHTPPEPLFKKYLEQGHTNSIAKYFAMCEWFDETCGALVDHIDDAGVGENTLVVYVTDNGWIQNPERGGYQPRSKRSPYEGGTRTPIIFRWPGTLPAADRSELCSSIDIVPTILAAAGAEAPHEFSGLNLLPALKSGKEIARDHIFGEAFAHDIADIENPSASLLFRWIIEGDLKLLLTYDGRQGKMKYRPQDFRPQLYNLVKDPGENENLAAANPKTVARLARRLEGWWPAGDRKTRTEWSDKPVLLPTADGTSR
ncbi:MAG: sulfatase [Planctomycetes bacterium]|nr:sulfatase [Planctomycetota bacterium]